MSEWQHSAFLLLLPAVAGDRRKAQQHGPLLQGVQALQAALLRHSVSSCPRVSLLKVLKISSGESPSARFHV